jgi:limonene-1,2-epoxide hydrolase
MTTESKAQQTVQAFLEAMNAEDFDKARSYVTDDLRFEGVLGTRNGADAYFSDMKNMKLKYEVLKTVAGDADVAVFYNIDMGRVKVFCAGWYALAGGQIATIKVVFDPRPLLDSAPKK